MLEIGPRLVEQHQRRRSVEALLDSAEQIQKHGDHSLVIELHEILGFKTQEPPVAEHIVIGIEERSHRTHNSEVLEGVPDVRVLHVCR